MGLLEELACGWTGRVAEIIQYAINVEAML